MVPSSAGIYSERALADPWPLSEGRGSPPPSLLPAARGSHVVSVASALREKQSTRGRSPVGEEASEWEGKVG